MHKCSGKGPESIGIVGIGNIGTGVYDQLRKHPQLKSVPVTAYGRDFGIIIGEDIARDYKKWRNDQTEGKKTTFSEWMKLHEADYPDNMTSWNGNGAKHDVYFITTPSTDDTPPYLLDVIRDNPSGVSILAEKQTPKKHYRDMASSLEAGNTWISATVGGNSGLLPAYIQHVINSGGIPPESYAFVNATTKVIADLVKNGCTIDEATEKVNKLKLTEPGPLDPMTPDGAISNEMGDMIAKMVILGNVSKQMTGDSDFITPENIQLYGDGVHEFIESCRTNPTDVKRIIAYLGTEDLDTLPITPFAEYRGSEFDMAIGSMVVPGKLNVLLTIEGKNSGMVVKTRNKFKKIADGAGAGVDATAARMINDCNRYAKGETMFAQ